MTAPVFADTKVFVYQLDTREAAKQRRARSWAEFLWATRRGRISFQVLQELYVTVTRKLDPGMDTGAARTMVRALWAWRPAPIDEQVFAAAWAAQDRFSLSWWDSLIVGAARVSGCSFLLTEDLQHGQDLDGLLVVSPFELAPADLGG